jgi:hypothetical protein
MRTNVVLDDDLVKKAFRHSRARRYRSSWHPSWFRKCSRARAMRANGARLESYLSSQPLVHPGDAEPYTAGRPASFRLSPTGLTVRSAIDYFIAQLALERRLALLHDDGDHAAIAHVRPLRTLP